MASPVDSNRVTTSVSTAATSHNINVGSPAAGNLLIVFVRFAGAPGTVTFTGYTQFAADTTDASDDDSRLYYRWADGTESTTDPMSTVNSIKLAAICWVITGAENPATTAPSVSSIVIGTAANINPGASPAFPASPASLTIDTTGSAANTNWGFGSTAGADDQYAQPFTLTGVAVTDVVVQVRKVNSPTDDVIVELRTDSAGFPSSTVVGSSATITNASMTTSYNAFTCSVNATGLTAGAKYHIVFRRSGAINGSNYFEISATTSNVLTSGRPVVFNGSTWGNATADWDFRLQTYENAARTLDLLFLTVIGLDSETATATQPTGYSNLANANSGTGGAVATNCMIWGASKGATAVTSDDPGAWTSSAPNAGVSAWTVAVPAPAAAAAPGPTPAMFKSPLRRRASRYLTFR